MKALATFLLTVCSFGQTIGFPGPGARHDTSGGSSPITFDNYTNVPYVGSGANSVSHTATGSNLFAVLTIWSDGTLSSVQYAGNAMTLATSHAVTGAVPGSEYIYIYIGPPSGTSTVSFSSTGQSTGSVWTFSHAKQSGQPDAVAAYISGTITANEAALPITTVADKSYVLGVYASASFIETTPSSNADNKGNQDFQTAYNWLSTATVTPAGAFTLEAKSSTTSVGYEAIGISIAPE